MDERELVHRCRALPDRFADRLGDDVLRILRMHSEGGEWGELVDNTLAALVQKAAPVTRQERDELAALVDGMRLEIAEPLDRLNVQG